MSLRVQNNRNDARSFTTLLCNDPVTGIRRSVLLSHRGAISSHCFRVLFAGRTYEHLTMRSLSVCSGRPLLVPTTRYRIICLCSIFLDKKANKKALHPSSRTKSVTFHSRVTTCIHQYLAISASASMYISYTLLPDYGGLRRVLLSRKVISSRGSRVFFTIG
jgi:hypothetical protein